MLLPAKPVKFPQLRSSALARREEQNFDSLTSAVTREAFLIPISKPQQLTKNTTLVVFSSSALFSTDVLQWQLHFNVPLSYMKTIVLRSHAEWPVSSHTDGTFVNTCGEKGVWPQNSKIAIFIKENQGGLFLSGEHTTQLCPSLGKSDLSALCFLFHNILLSPKPQCLLSNTPKRTWGVSWADLPAFSPHNPLPIQTQIPIRKGLRRRNL